MISKFCCWLPSVEAVWKFFGCCFCGPVDWLPDWFTNDWFLLDESCFKLSISSCRCLICLFNPSSLVWFIDELDRGVGFLNLFMYIAYVFYLYYFLIFIYLFITYFYVNLYDITFKKDLIYIYIYIYIYIHIYNIYIYMCNI